MTGRMTLQKRMFLIIATVMVAVFAAFEAISYRQSEASAVADLRASAERVRAVLMSLRRVYQHEFLDSELPIDERTIGFLPAVALSRISADLHNWDVGGFSFNNVSDRPRNPRNLADEVEMAAIEHFRRHPEESLRFISFRSPEGEPYYHYARPIRVETYCLQCHGKREEAPAGIRARYDSAWDYQVGELRGIMSIKVPARHMQQRVAEEFRQRLLWHLGLFLLLSLAVAWAFRRYHGRPLAQLVEQIDKVAAGNLAARVEALPGEFGRIGQAFNRMTEVVQTDRDGMTASQQRLRDIAYHDPLTGLPNRLLFFDRLELAQAQAQRSGRLAALCYVDLDGFKKVNDEFGHGVGDQLLKEAARRLRETVRAGDTVARLGGDEFGLLLVEIGSAEEIEQTLDRVLAAMAMPFLIEGHRLGLSASAGVALLPEDQGSAEQLLRHADEAMYQAKSAGRNCYRLFDAERNQLLAAHRARLLRLRDAHERGEFRLRYQPKIHLKQGRLLGLEATMHWQHPEKGLLPPAEFAAAIEDSDLAAPAGRWLLTEALRQSAAWSAAGLDVPVSVNIPGRALQDKEFGAWLADRVAGEANLKPALFCIEIAEAATLIEADTVAVLVADCHRLGLRVSLDGFGIAYTSLTWLREIGVDELKIAPPLIRSLLDSRDSQAVVRGILALGRAFGLDVVADGLDEPEQGTLLSRYGCDVIQDARAESSLAAADVPAWLAALTPDTALAEFLAVKVADADLPLLAARLAHRQWLRQLTAFVEGRAGKPAQPPERDPARCGLGRWYYGPGSQRYGAMASYCELDAAHRDFHSAANEIIDLKHAGQDAAAGERLAALGLAGKRIRTLIDELLIEAAMNGEA